MTEKKLKIAVNCRMLILNRLDGTGWFAYHILSRLTRSHPDIEFTFLFDRPYDPSFVFGHNVTPVVLFPPTRHPLLTHLWFQVSVRRYLLTHRPDLFISPDGIVVPGVPLRQLGVIHDLNFEHRPQDLPWAYRTYFRYMYRRSAHAATRLITVSQFSQNDIARTYGIPTARIDIVPNAPSDIYRPLPESEQQRVRDEYSNGSPYFIFVGSLSPRKNVPTLLKAFDAFKAESHSTAKLVIVGATFWGGHDIRDTLMKMRYKDDVLFTGRVADSELPKLMAAALSLVYLPYFEGFGVPVLEAMQSHTATIVSNATALPEIAGNASALTDTDNIEAIKNTLIKVSGDHTVREALISRGAARAAQFSWDTSAQLFWTSVEKTFTSAL